MVCAGGSSFSLSYSTLAPLKRTTQLSEDLVLSVQDSLAVEKDIVVPLNLSTHLSKDRVLSAQDGLAVV